MSTKHGLHHSWRIGVEVRDGNPQGEVSIHEICIRHSSLCIKKSICEYMPSGRKQEPRFRFKNQKFTTMNSSGLFKINNRIL